MSCRKDLSVLQLFCGCASRVRANFYKFYITIRGKNGNKTGIKGNRVK